MILGTATYKPQPAWRPVDAATAWKRFREVCEGKRSFWRIVVLNAAFESIRKPWWAE